MKMNKSKKIIKVKMTSKKSIIVKVKMIKNEIMVKEKF